MARFVDKRSRGFVYTRNERNGVFAAILGGLENIGLNTSEGYKKLIGQPRNCMATQSSSFKIKAYLVRRTSCRDRGTSERGGPGATEERLPRQKKSIRLKGADKKAKYAEEGYG